MSYDARVVNGIWAWGLVAALGAAPGEAATAEAHDVSGAATVDAIATPGRRCAPPEPVDVLFIGNSYLLMHRIEALVAALGDQAGVKLRTELLAMGGKNFEYHVARDETAEVLASREWDYVILQSHSLDTIRNREGFLVAGEGLVELVREAGAEPLLFETWARKADSSIYRFGRAGYDPPQMHEMVHDGYAQLSRRTGAEVIDVGAAWLAFTEHVPDLDPYASDSNHPGKLGSYLSANVVFAALTDLTPVGNVETLLGLSDEAARLAQRQAADVVGPECDALTPIGASAAH